MEMIGRSDHDCVDVLLLVEHLAEVGKDFGLGIFFEGVPGVVRVDVAQGDDIFAAELFEVGCALASNADSGNVDFFAWRSLSVETENVARNDHEGRRGCGCGAKEGTARKGGRGCLHGVSTQGWRNYFNSLMWMLRKETLPWSPWRKIGPG